MFAVKEVTIQSRFEVAAAQLTDLIKRDGLHSASHAAYAEGLAAEASASLPGSAWGSPGWPVCA